MGHDAEDYTRRGRRARVISGDRGDSDGCRAVRRCVDFVSLADQKTLIPITGINFAAYEALRGIITPPGQTSVPRKLLCGALAGVLVMYTWSASD